MDSAHWQRLEEVFLAALEKEPADVGAFLDEAARGDASFRAEVQELLAAHGRTGGLAIEAMLSESGADLGMARVGPFRLVERIGRGGMGEVFRAERVDGHFEQTVAVKLIRSGVTTSEMLRRFRAERQILARLEHPSIARLLDGGVTEQGLPYLAMEYVAGRSIAEHCSEKELSLEARLALFVTVCRAVQYAHQNLVVHRDLKPSNILVTAQGDVKLLDFGVAKLLESEPDGTPVTSRTVLEMMTPEYASPEQVRGGPITTATDVYALGLLLYELLTGRRAQERVGSSVLEMERTICETEVPSPSDAVTGGLRKRLRGDLDVIAATAMRKDPARRYASAEQLAEDVERHLKGLALIARPDTLHYRATTFLRRHRVAVGAGTAVLLSLVAGLALAVAGRMRAERAEATAVTEAATSTRITDFLVDMFRQSDPGVARGETVTVRAFLDRGAERIEELSDQPRVQARLLTTMAQAYDGLGLFDPALGLYERAFAIQRDEFGPKSKEAARAMTCMADLYSKKGDYSRSRDTSKEAIAILEAVAPPDSLGLANAYSQLGITLSHLGETVEARSVLERVLEIRERKLGSESITLAGPLTNLAIALWQTGELDSARTLYERVLSIQEQTYNGDHVAIAHTLNNLALVHEGKGETQQALALHEQALVMRERLLGADHPDVGETLNNLGNTLMTLQEYDRARPVLERALKIREKALGPEHEYVAATLTNIGLAIINQGGGEAARSSLERSLRIFEHEFGADHASVSYPLLALAYLDSKRGDVAGADARFRRGIRIREQQMGEGHPQLAEARRDYATFLRERGRTAEAEAVERPRTSP